MNICVFASGGGSNFNALLQAKKDGFLNSDFKLLITNNSHCGAVDIALANDIDYYHISKKVFPDLSESDFHKLYVDILDEYEVDLILLAGYMKMVDNIVIRKFRNRIINIHPALLPSFGGKGMYGMNVHKAVIESGAKESGITIHLVDEFYDKGKILLQKKLAVNEDDNEHTLQKRVLELEHKYYPQVVKKIETGELILE
ncbi:MAG: phosphoribosylglycinamide formyltransferase [Ignavibacteriota bacterium]